MNYVTAFNALGYEVPAPRTDWSAEKPEGVCITLWKSEVTWSPPQPHMDLWARFAPGTAEWEAKPGHAKRTKHIQRAMTDFDGWVDVVIVTGTPGQGVESADPWRIEQRRNHAWRIKKFDSATGYFSIATEQRG